MCSTSRKITPNSCSTPSSHDRPQGRPVSGASCDAPIGPRAVEVGSVTIKAKAMGEQHAYRQTSSPRTRIVEFTSRRHLRCCATVLAPGSQLGRQRGASLEGFVARPLRRLPADEGVKAALYVLGINLHYVLHSTIHTFPSLSANAYLQTMESGKGEREPAGTGMSGKANRPRPGRGRPACHRGCRIRMAIPCAAARTHDEAPPAARNPMHAASHGGTAAAAL